MAVMESVEEENDENIDPANFGPEDSEDDFGETDSTARDKKLNAITVSDKLGMACFRCVTKNSCSIPNCEYSHDRDIVAAARDKQMADLTEAKRQMQPGHQATLKAFDIIDQHTGCEDACFKRIALMTKNFLEDILKKGCQTTVTVLCLEKDLYIGYWLFSQQLHERRVHHQRVT